MQQIAVYTNQANSTSKVVNKVQPKSSLLLVEDDVLLAQKYIDTLQSELCRVTHVTNGQAALQSLQKELPDVILLDLLLPDIHGLEVLTQIQEQAFPVTVVVVTSQAGAEIAVKALHLGVFDYLVKPVDAERLITTVRNALERNELRRCLYQHQGLPRDRFAGFIGLSPVMQAMYRIIESAASSSANVFITGESGTGKELCAEAIHYRSARTRKPLVSINCAAIPRELLESELFGHTKGAFTGATSDRKGAAAEANGGTLFFDEICDLDLDLQAKLLRFIQSRRFRRVGDNNDEITDVRFVCATNRDPLAEVHAGRFREDLYYRLFVVPIELPPLRSRGDDILLLARNFLQKYADEESKNFDGYSQDAEQKMRVYEWPGNVRQLQNLIHKLVVIHDGGLVDASMLALPHDSGVLHAKDQDRASLTQASYTAKQSDTLVNASIRPLWLEEKEIIERAIELCGGNVLDAAERLGISDSTIYRKRRKWFQPGEIVGA